MLSKIISKIIPITVILIAWLSIERMSSFRVGSTTTWIFFMTIILIVFFLEVYYSYIDQKDKQAIQFVKWYLLWNIFCVLRGIFVAETSWDQQVLLVNSMSLFMPIIAFIALNIERVQRILLFYAKYMLPFFIVVLYLYSFESSTINYLYLVGLLMLFFPAFKTRHKAIILFLSFFSIVRDLQTRSLIFQFGLPILIVMIFYYMRFFIISVKIMEYVRKVFIVAPWFFFFLGVSGVFNVFQIHSYIKTDYEAQTTDSNGEVVTQDITQDSRTLTYEEVLHSAQKHNYWVLGRSPARGNDVVELAVLVIDYPRDERIRNEAAILNIFTWTGTIGVLLYCFVFYKASWLAVNKSNNIYSKIIGLFVAFRWLYAWVEDMNVFNLNYFTIWLMIGICLSGSFRKMNNTEVKLWARGIFERKNFIGHKNIVFQNNPSKI